MRALFLILMVLTIVGGAGIGYFFFMDEAHAASDKKAEKSEGMLAGTPEYVELSPLILPIIDGNGISQSISVVVTLEVDSFGKADKVRSKMPRLSDAFLQDMYGSLSRHAALQGGVVKVSSIKKRLARVSNKVMGPDIIDDVLIQVVQQRRV